MPAAGMATGPVMCKNRRQYWIPTGLGSPLHEVHGAMDSERLKKICQTREKGKEQ